MRGLQQIIRTVSQETAEKNNSNFYYMSDVPSLFGKDSTSLHAYKRKPTTPGR